MNYLLAILIVFSYFISQTIRHVFSKVLLLSILQLETLQQAVEPVNFKYCLIL